jgi:hypothetical protein
MHGANMKKQGNGSSRYIKRGEMFWHAEEILVFQDGICFIDLASEFFSFSNSG